jgi:HCOMODA/2-hydroxy-3-carboxy-muconic semialdehyde decarboxylase
MTEFAPQQRLVRMAARALAKGGLVTAFGHCSVRVSPREFLVCAAKPMGLIEAGEPGTVVHVSQPLPEGVLGEVRIHQQIYARRPEVQAVCRFMSPQVMALAAMGLAPSARHGFSSYFYPCAPMWSDPRLVRNEPAAEGVAQAMGAAPAVVLSVNGAVTAADSIEKAVALAWFLEDAARVELAVRCAGGAAVRIFPDAHVAAERATWNGRIAERIWDFLCAGDPELSSPNLSRHD